MWIPFIEAKYLNCDAQCKYCDVEEVCYGCTALSADLIKNEKG